MPEDISLSRALGETNVGGASIFDFVDHRTLMFSANIGGIYGLCMGGSIISIIEVMWLLLELIYICLTSRFPRRVNPQEGMNKNDKIFQISGRKFENFPVKAKDSPKTRRGGKVFSFAH